LKEGEIHTEFFSFFILFSFFFLFSFDHYDFFSSLSLSPGTPSLLVQEKEEEEDK